MLAGQNVADVRKFIAKLGEQPVESFYRERKGKEEKLRSRQSGGMFGVFTSGKGKQGQQEDGDEL